ncbi:MAG: hypothetical protein EPN23_03690 [Verrucomicrobia bacterium]|nr:MAG: hypothetical protein EPN23_03690 [Verrucomicrobiota bacterium]
MMLADLLALDEELNQLGRTKMQRHKGLEFAQDRRGIQHQASNRPIRFIGGDGCGMKNMVEKPMGCRHHDQWQQAIKALKSSSCALRMRLFSGVMLVPCKASLLEVGVEASEICGFRWPNHGKTATRPRRNHME